MLASSAVTHEPVRVHVAAATRLYREGLARALGEDRRVRVVDSSPDLPAPASLLDRRVELLVLDATGRATRSLARLHSAVPKVYLLVIGLPETGDALIGYAEAGVVGFVSAEASIQELVRAIEDVVRDGAHCPPRLVVLLLQHVAAGLLRRSTLPSRLTARELEIVELLGRGYPNREIGEALGIELPTVKNHIHNILEKLGVERRSQVFPLVQSGAGDPDPVPSLGATRIST